jgi:hypothetical protein
MVNCLGTAKVPRQFTLIFMASLGLRCFLLTELFASWRLRGEKQLTVPARMVRVVVSGEREMSRRFADLAPEPRVNRRPSIVVGRQKLLRNMIYPDDIDSDIIPG